MGRLRDNYGKDHGAPDAFPRAGKSGLGTGYVKTTGKLRTDYGKTTRRLRVRCVFPARENASGLGTGYGETTGRLREDYGTTTLWEDYWELREDYGKTTGVHIIL